MGSYTFRWEHPSNEVYVTGTFDNWSKSVKLDRDGTAHEKTVNLPESNEKILYKFVADGDWKTDHTAKTEPDHEGNLNNVLYPEDIKPASTSAAVLSSVAPGASTTKMAGEQPTETPARELPGAFPETPAALDNQQFSVNPIPASEGAGNPISLAAGEKVPDSSTFNTNTIDSHVKDDPSLKESSKDSEQIFGVAPLPASSGIGNPVNLAAGEKVPSSFSSSDINSNVHDDPELKAKDTEQSFGVAPLPATGGIGNPISLAPGEKVPDSNTITSNTLDNNVKLDKESYEKSDTGAPILPPISPQTEREAAGASIFGLGPTTGNNIIPESSLPMGDKAVSDLGNLGPTTSSVAPTSTTNDLAGQQPIEPRGVPTVVSESQEEAHVEPEAAANPEAVQEKSAFEDELKSKVPEEPATAESGALGKSENSNGGIAGAVTGGLAAAGAAVAGGAYALRDKTNTQNISSVAPTSTTKDLAGQQPIESRGVPSVVSESQQQAHQDPEATANPEAVQEKSALEQELKAKVPEEPATAESGVLGKSESSNAGITGAVAGGVAAAGAAAAGGAYALREKATETTGKDPVSYLPQNVQDSISNMNSKGTTAPATTRSTALHEQSASSAALSNDATIPQQTAINGPVTVPATSATTSAVPEQVLTSQKEAHVEPEAAANAEAVAEKKDVEKELLSEIKPVQSAGEPAPTITSATSATAPTTATSAIVPPTTTSASGAPQLNDPTKDVSPITMDNTTSTTDAADKGLNASADTPAVPPTQKEGQTLAAPVTPTKPADSRDVSPMSKVATANHPSGVAEPTVTTGVASSSVPTESKPESKPVGSRPAAANSTPAKRGSFIDKLKSTPESTKTAASGSDSTKKRRSLFGRIKDKLKQ